MSTPPVALHSLVSESPHTVYTSGSACMCSLHNHGLPSMATACHLQTILAWFKFQDQAGIFRLMEGICGHMYQAAQGHGTCICLFLLKPVQKRGPCRANQTEDQRVAALAANAARQRERR
jgi:hypothetical protein